MIGTTQGSRNLGVGAAFAAVVTTVVAVVLGLAGPVAAHDPIFLTDEQTTADTGPYLPDGAISRALYGTLHEPGQTRGFEFDLRAGEELYISLLIPELEPETALGVGELPTMELTRPDGTVLAVEPIIGGTFDEPFSNTSYVTLHESREPAQAGRYAVLVTGRAPARFTAAVGEREEFGTPAERTVDRPSGFAAIAEPLSRWYSTPPGADAVAGDPAGSEVEIDEEAARAALAALDDTAENAGEVEVASDGRADAEAAAGAGAGEDTPDDGGARWVVPLALVAVVLAGLAVLGTRRRGASDAS